MEPTRPTDASPQLSTTPIETSASTPMKVRKAPKEGAIVKQGDVAGTLRSYDVKLCLNEKNS